MHIRITLKFGCHLTTPVPPMLHYVVLIIVLVNESNHLFQLLEQLQQFASRLTTRAHQMSRDVSQLIHDTRLTDAKIESVTDYFLTLSDHQFIENVSFYTGQWTCSYFFTPVVFVWFCFIKVHCVKEMVIIHNPT